MTGPDDAALERTARRVTVALRRRAETIEVAPDAYARLATRVTADGRDVGPRYRTDGRAVAGRPRPWWLPSGRFAVAAVLGLLALGGGLALVARDLGPDQPVASAVDDSAPVAVTGLAGPGPEPDSGAESDPESVVPRDDGLVGPVAPTPLAAAEAFLRLLDIHDAVAVERDGEIVVQTPAEAGGRPEIDVARLELADVTGTDASGWAVIEARGPSVTIDTPLSGTIVVGPAVEVGGTGTGFDGAIEVEVRSALDGTPLHRSSAEAGGRNLVGPYETVVELAGVEPAWIIVRSAVAGDGVAGSFAAVPIFIDGPVDDTVFVVAGVDLDDPDGGLNLRARPDAESERLTVLPWATPVVKAGDPPVLIGDQVWWLVTPVDQEATGWVNARYLAAAREPGRAEGAARLLLAVAADPALAGPWLPVSDRLGFTVFVDGDRAQLEAEELHRPEGWTAPVLDGASLEQLLAGGAEPQLTTEVATGEIAARYFAGLPSITARYLAPDGRDRTVRMFFESGPVGVQAIGAIVTTG